MLTSVAALCHHTTLLQYPYVSSVLNHTRTQVNALSELTPSAGDLIIISGSARGVLGGKPRYLFRESLP